MSDIEKIDAQLSQAMQEAASAQVGEPVLVAGWVAVCEVITESNGDHTLVTMMDNHTPPWDAYGMLMWAADSLTEIDDE